MGDITSKVATGGKIIALPTLIIGAVLGGTLGINGCNGYTIESRFRRDVGDGVIDFINSKAPSKNDSLSKDDCLRLLKENFDFDGDNHLSSEELARAQEAIKTLRWGWRPFERNHQRQLQYARAGRRLEEVLNNWPWPNDLNLTRVPPSPLFIIPNQK